MRPSRPGRRRSVRSGRPSRSPGVAAEERLVEDDLVVVGVTERPSTQPSPHRSSPRSTMTVPSSAVASVTPGCQSPWMSMFPIWVRRPTTCGSSCPCRHRPTGRSQGPARSGRSPRRRPRAARCRTAPGSGRSVPASVFGVANRVTGSRERAAGVEHEQVPLPSVAVSVVVEAVRPAWVRARRFAPTVELGEVDVGVGLGGDVARRRDRRGCGSPEPPPGCRWRRTRCPCRSRP